ncbi:MAG TPA: DUF2231 domain-containing protein [bacterium]|nr:DUF2231 domain-containing protein [bacterium]
MLDSLSDALGWLHPPATHFPIVCSILAFLAFAFSRGRDWLQKSAAALWILAFLTGVPSVLLGHLFAHHLGLVSTWSWLPPASALKGQLRFHALLGSLGLLLSAATLWGAGRLARGKPVSFALQLTLGLFTAALFGAAGHEGGEMVYGGDEAPAVSTATPPSPATAASTSSLTERAKSVLPSLVKMNTRPWVSKTHGGRWVDTYVSRDAVKAYQDSDPLPPGTWVVKESFEDAGGKPSTVKGPLYVMRKGPQKWDYAMEWDKPVPGNPEKITGPVTWLPGNAALDSCVKCHSHFHNVDYMGGVPTEAAVP